MFLLLIPVYLVLLALGAKATWKLVLNILSGTGNDVFSIEGIVFSAILFTILFLLIGPIMGIVTAAKYFMQKSSK